ncbi:glycosyltransferase [Desulfobacterota bacterium M19]
MEYPLLVFWHGWQKDFALRVEKKYLWFFRKTFGRADGFIVLASEFEQTLRDWGVTVPVYLETTNVEEKLVTGFNVQAKWPEAPTTAGETIKILFLARLERAKGVFETIQAVNLLLKKQYPVCLTIAGDGAIRQELEQFTRSLGLSSEQVFLSATFGAGKRSRPLLTIISIAFQHIMAKACPLPYLRPWPLACRW